MAHENNQGAMNTQNNAPKQVQGNKTFFKNEINRRSFLYGTGAGLIIAATCLGIKVLAVKIKTAWQARKAAADAAVETADPEKPAGK